MLTTARRGAQGVSRSLGGRSASLRLAICLLAGVGATRALSQPEIGAAVGLGGLALALPRSLRHGVLGLAAGLVLGWHGLVPAPRSIDLTRPVAITAQQIGTWRSNGELRTTKARIETVRQGAVVARWRVEFWLSVPREGEPPGRRWRLRGRLGRPPALANREIGAAPPWRLRLKSARLMEPLPLSGIGGRLAATAARARHAILARVEAASPERPGSSLVRALALGDTAALPEAWLRGLRRTGTAHVVALSGLHLGVVGVWCALASRRLPRGWRFAAVLVGTSCYLVLGGPRPSLLRAWLMVLAAGATALRRASPRPGHALVWAAAVLGALDPGCVGDLGFRLTIVATAGVILGGRLLPRWWPAVPRVVAGSFGATLGAQLATMPFTLPVFHWLPVWGWLWNLLIVPVVAVAVPVSLAWSALAAVRPEAAAAVVLPLDLMAAWIALPSTLPPAVGGGVPWAGGGWGIAGGLLLLVLVSRWRWLWIPAAAIGVLASGPCGAGNRTGTAVHFLDVGQGDAILVRDGPGGLLIDGGGWRGSGLAEKALLPALGGLRLRRLEAVVLSHGDRDHCRGLLEIAGYVAIDEIWMAPGTAGVGCGRRLALTAGARLRPLWAGELAAWRGWRFAALNPRAGSRGSSNEDSLVLRGESRGRSILFTGDIGGRTERRLLGAGAGMQDGISILKVAHHGSSSSSSRALLRAARPRLAVISAGRSNPFGHPAADVLDRLEREGIALFRIDRSGSLEVSWRRNEGWRLSTPGAAR